MEINTDEIRKCRNDIEKMKKEVNKVVVGQEEVLTAFARALMCDGHVLVEGVPGTAKTLIIRSIAKVTGCLFNRIQFTVDLLPSDIIGITAYDKDRGFYTVKGPVFANFIIADEINRAPPKSQSALLEAMQERQVTIGTNTYPLPNPFFVMASQNPIESAGVYPLPEAQIDRFLFKILIGYPKLTEERYVLKQNITLRKFDDFNLQSVITPQRILEMQNLTKQIYLSEEIEKYIINIVDATRNSKKYKIDLGKYIEWGVSPRAGIGMFIAAKAEALLREKIS